jgi:hypothetical protein
LTEEAKVFVIDKVNFALIIIIREDKDFVVDVVNAKKVTIITVKIVIGSGFEELNNMRHLVFRWFILVFTH